jgi:diguanylate cyclase
MRTTDKTLFEQMQISDIEIEHRKELLAITNSDIDLLKSCKAIIELEVLSIVNDFYKQQTSIDEISLLIGDADSLARLHVAMKGYIISIFNGYYDTDYVNNRLRIGLVHKRIGVGPKLYLSAMKTLKDLIYEALERNVNDKHRLFNIYIILDKLFYLDATLVFDTYIRSLLSEIETAKKRTEQYAKSLEEKVALRTSELESLSKKDTLSQVFNQRTLFDTLRKEISRSRRTGSALSLVYFDVDKFKEVNDNYGHHKGDEVIVSIGEILNRTCREIDTPCRYGGDEFCVILPETKVDSAVVFCKRFIAEFKKIYDNLTLSFGVVTTLANDERDADAFIKDADTKMYEAKKKPGFHIAT